MPPKKATPKKTQPKAASATVAAAANGKKGAVKKNPVLKKDKPVTSKTAPKKADNLKTKTKKLTEEVKKETKSPKRKREESKVVDVEKKVKEDDEVADFPEVNLKILTLDGDLEEISQADIAEVISSHGIERPFIKFFSNADRIRIGRAACTFRDEESYETMAKLSSITVNGKTLSLKGKPVHDPSRTAFVANFAFPVNEERIKEFFEGIEIDDINYLSARFGKLKSIFEVVFSNPTELNKALEKNGVEFDEREVAVSRILPVGERPLRKTPKSKKFIKNFKRVNAEEN